MGIPLNITRGLEKQVLGTDMNMVMSLHRWPPFVIAIFVRSLLMTTPAYADPLERAEFLGLPRAPDHPADIAERFSSLEFEEHELAREVSLVETDRMITLSLYIGGITLTIGSVAMLVSAVLQGACVSEDFGCYSTRELIMGGIPVALVGGVVLAGAALTDSRVGARQRALDERRESLEQRRRIIEGRAGFALGPASLELRITF